MAKIYDSATGRTTTYYYDFTDRLMKYVESGENYNHSVGYEYDEINNLTALVETINGVERQTSYTYDLDNRVTGITTGDSGRSYSYDALGRISQWVTKHGNDTVFSDEFTFAAPSGTGAGTTTGQIARHYIASSHTDGLDIAYTYTYDDNGNILSISDGTNTTSYTYDTANQLLRENNQAANKTYVWTYDNAGNILSRSEYAYTTAENPTNPIDTVLYTYGDSDWGDLLTAYDGQTITYDTIGNPLSDGTWNYSWEHGRQLASMTSDTTTWYYTYNSDGLRTKRTNGTTTYEYVYNGSSLSQMTVDGNTLRFAYDANGLPMSVTYNGTDYYYVTNIQGDIIAILDSSGATVVTYTYDAWGNILTAGGTLATTLGTHNPLRYRGYVYDPETSLYYLQSRYYNPEIGRFINADAFIVAGITLLANNTFSYCQNNPVTNYDSTGYWTISVGVGANVTCGLGLSIGIGIAFDDNGNIEVQWNYSAPIKSEATSAGAIDCGAAIQLQVTGVDTVSDLHGSSTYIGGSGGELGYLGFDLVSCSPAANNNGRIDGFQGTFGIGAGIDAHVAQTYTKPICSFTWKDVWGWLVPWT